MDYNQKPIKIFIAYMMRHKALFFIDMLCIIISAGIDLAFPFVSRIAMYRLLPEKLFKTFFFIMAILILSYLLKGFLYYIINVVGHKMGVLTEADLRRDIFSHIQELSCSFFDKNRTGIIMSRITNDLFEVTELAHHGPEFLLVCVLTIVGSLALMYSIEWRLALLLTIALPLGMWYTLAQRMNMRKANLAVKQKTAEINAAIESAVSGARTAKAFANEEIEKAKFDATNDEFKTSKVDYYKTMGSFQAGMEFTTGVMPVLVILAGGLLIMQGRLDYVNLVTFTLYVATFISPLRKIALLMEQYMTGSAGFERFLEIMRTEPEIKDAEDAFVLGQIEGNVEYKNVSFAYGNGVKILDNINFTLESGKSLALVGPSGGGKTTICRLLPRFYDVSEGSITVDGHDVRYVTQASLRRDIGILEQDVFLFAGTIKDNILYGKPDATDEEVIQAAKLAQIHDEIMDLPDGYNSYIGERGVMLSGGQKQRVSIARVFLKNPKILILDEATSALDSVTERRIQASLDELSRGRTSIIIAHRLSTIRNADKIAVVYGEKIIEMGSHDELIAKDGAYAKLWRAQMEV